MFLIWQAKFGLFAHHAAVHQLWVEGWWDPLIPVSISSMHKLGYGCGDGCNVLICLIQGQKFKTFRYFWQRAHAHAIYPRNGPSPDLSCN